MEVSKYFVIILQLLVMVSFNWSFASFDVYLNRHEVMRLLGLSGELFYVRDGHVNEYAMNFIVLVPASMNTLTFNWQSYSEEPLLYTLNVDVSDRSVIPYPHFNVTNTGRIPSGLTDAFSVTLACSGDANAEVNVTIRLDVTVNDKSFHMRDDDDILDIESVRNDERLLVDYDDNAEIIHDGEVRKRRSSPIFSNLKGGGVDVKMNRREHGMLTPNLKHDIIPNYPNKNSVISLVFRRKKICLKIADENISSNMVYVDNLGSTADPPMGLLHLILGSACAIGAVCITFLAVRFCSFRPLKRERRAAPITRSLLIHHDHREIDDNEKVMIVSQMRNGDFKSCGTDLNVSGKMDSAMMAKKDKIANAKDRLSGGDERSKEERLQDKIAEITIQRCRIRLSCLLQEGTFGRVYRGTYAEQDPDSDCSFSRDTKTGLMESNSDYQMLAQHSASSNNILGIANEKMLSKTDDRASADNNETQVLVKTVSQQHASREQVSLLLQEGLMLYGLRHPNLLTVLGVSIEDCTAPFIVYRLQGEHHNLKNVLQSLSAPGLASSSFPRRVVTTRELVCIGLQISQALAYAHSRRCFHGDVATRNCAIDENLHVRLGDFALSRDLFPQDYHCLGDNVNRPVKWLSHEALTRGIYEAPNDAWEFGVLLWELVTLGRMPYKDIDPGEIADYLEKGYRLDQPKNCPDELFMIMSCCWAINANDRPTFAQLENYLQEFYDQLICYV